MPMRDDQPSRRDSRPVRTGALAIAAVLITIGGLGNALVVVPDLHGDLIEIGVRRTVLNGTVDALYFAALANFGFAIIVSAAALQSARGIAPARIPLVVAALIYTITGVMVFSRSHNPHHFAAIVMGALLFVAVADGLRS